jgi:DNA-binding GntR family transcriptional regulator
VGRIVDVRRWPEQVDASSGLPLHAQVHAIIEGHLQRDGYQVGDQLPSELELRKRFSVSRPTLRQALADLEADAWIERRRGIGTTIVREPGPVWSLTVDPRRSFAAPVQDDPGDRTTVEVIGRSLQVAGSQAAEVLATNQTLAIDRVLRLAGLPVGSCRTWLPRQGFDDLLTEPLSGGSVSQTLVDRYGRVPGSRDVRVSSVRAEPSEAQLFKLPARAPVLELHSVERDEAGDVSWYATTYYNGAEVSLEMVSSTSVQFRL